MQDSSQTDPGYPMPPRPEEVSRRDRDSAMGAYLMMFAAWFIGLPLPILNLGASFAFWVSEEKRSRFVGFHALQSLLGQIPVSLMNTGMVAWTVYALFSWHFPAVFFGYLATTVLVNLIYVGISLYACLRARKGRMFYFPLFGQIAFDRYYGPDAIVRGPGY